MICEHCRRNPCGCVVVKDGTRYAPARRVCGEVFDAGGYPQGCTREPHEGDDHRADALVFAADLGAGGPPSAEFFAQVEREAELLINDHMMFGRAVVRGGHRVPPEEWGSVWPPVSSGVSFNFGSDPLSFIGRAANEGA